MSNLADTVVDDLSNVCHYSAGSSLFFGGYNLHYPLWGVRSATLASECFVGRLSNSPYCLLNSLALTHLARSGACSLTDLSLCSVDLNAHTSLQVEDDLFDNDHFPISIFVDIVSPFQSRLIYYR